MTTYPIKQFYSIVVSTSPRAKRNIPFFEMNVGDTENFTGVATMKKENRDIFRLNLMAKKAGVFSTQNQARCFVKMILKVRRNLLITAYLQCVIATAIMRFLMSIIRTNH